MTVVALLRLMAGTRPIPGRHLLVTAHPDDESISMGGALSRFEDVRILQLTDGEASADRNALRRLERRAAFAAAGWNWPVYECGGFSREVHAHLGELLPIIQDASADCDVVWTHPYEGGHVDHDSAAWLVQRARPLLRMELASYHCSATAQIFGDFWPDAQAPSVSVTLAGVLLDRKMAAIRAYESQAHIVRKFPDLAREVYRVAPVYDFTRPAPVPRSRWDWKGYEPSTQVWRRAVGDQEAA